MPGGRGTGHRGLPGRGHQLRAGRCGAFRAIGLEGDEHSRHIRRQRREEDEQLSILANEIGGRPVTRGAFAPDLVVVAGGRRAEAGEAGHAAGEVGGNVDDTLGAFALERQLDVPGEQLALEAVGPVARTDPTIDGDGEADGQDEDRGG